MFVMVRDGTAVFAIYKVRAKMGDSVKTEIPGQIESEEIICYSEEELAKAKFVLDKFKIPHTIEPLSFSAEMKQKVQGIKYNSRSEAIEHIQSNIEPESQRISNLLKRLNEAEEKNKLIPDLIARLEQAESKISNLQKTIKL